ncbi:hypothetical protein HD806DRAFT_461061 [Xylariaceae sp. AK1471]|nr:hypothetical protein HD806DRAFT_461061 [Xylariaceae sp. AK1471]
MRTISQWLSSVLMLAIVAALPTTSHRSPAKSSSTAIELYCDASCGSGALMRTLQLSDGECQNLEQGQVISVRVTTAPYCEIGQPLLYLFEEPQCSTPHLCAFNDGDPECFGSEISRRIESIKFECADKPDYGGECTPFPQASVLVTANSVTSAATTSYLTDDERLVKAVLGSVQSIQGVTIAILILTLIIFGLAAYSYWRSYYGEETPAVQGGSP